ncbi:cytochrome c [Tautonia sp. JC769]|uniref:c-type cytochrome n=1 Tax=Tautonia sp. JC769 TaxID=3232135 RepID=UPI003458DE0B
MIPRSLPPADRRRLGRWLWRGLAALVVLAAVLGLGVYVMLFREVPQRLPVEPGVEPIATYFKYGSIGAENTDGIPYPIWVVLPHVFADKLPRPGGYLAFGMPWEAGDELPIGISKKTIGFPRVAINCAFCHVASYRTEPDGPRQVVLGGPGNRARPLEYVRFLSECAEDPRFNADTLLPAIQYYFDLSPVEKQLYRHVLIPLTRDGLLEQGERYAWTESRPDWLVGRIDPFNPVKYRQLGIDWREEREELGFETIGNSDMQPLWNLAMHRAAEPGGPLPYSYHWDGLNTDLKEVVYSGAIGDGATTESLPVQELDAMQAWLEQLPPPPYPFPVDRELADLGKPIYDRLCADCHAFDGTRTGTVIPRDEIGTDPHRIDMWTEEAMTIYNSFARGEPWAFRAFVKQDGYASVPLDGLWLRAPYLHNGSVPTLEDLMKPSGERPKVFYRGYDVYIDGGTGFIFEGPEAEAEGDRYDTAVPGNSNVGHEGPDYGTDLPESEKRAVIEYMKTL